MAPSQNPPHSGATARLVVAVSGRGRSLANFLKHEQGELGCYYQVVGVITSAPQCPAAELAAAHKLPVYTGSFAGEVKASRELCAFLDAVAADWIALAGFVRIFPTDFSQTRKRYEGRIVNIHPSLLPHFAGRNMYGSRVHAAVLQAGVAQSGASVHFVNERYDEGAIIAQIRVPVFSGEAGEALAARVFAAECQLYPHTIAELVGGRLPLPGGAIHHMDFS